MAQADNRQQMNTLLKYLAEQLYPSITSLVSGEPARPIPNLPANPGKVQGTDDPRMGAGAIELVDLLSNAVPLKAMASIPAAIAARSPWARSALKQAEKVAKEAAGAQAPLQGLPTGPFDVGGAPFVAGPVAHAREAAEKYMAGRGLPYEPPKTYTPVNEDRAARIARAFDEMKHAPDDPAVKASYDAMIEETVAQFNAMRDAGIKIEFIKPGMDDPYKASPRLAQQDVIKNKHLWVFPTDSGFGSGGESAEAAMKNNPLLRDTGIEIDGRKLKANDVFRIVHDYYGHIKEGHGFRAGGEENAWRAHSAMYSDAARPAMTTETRGQNSWVNYGPHGEKNRKASAADTIYADQKIGLLPDWVVNEGRLDPGATYVNIGMDIPGGGKLTEKQINAALKKAGVKVLDRKLHQSDTEMTSVLQLDRPLTKKEANEVSTALKQESIAQFTERHGGELYGPKAAEWGPFNPDYFLTPDGKRLSQLPDMNTVRPPRPAELTPEERAATLANVPFPQFAQQYPQPATPKLKTDTKTGKQYLGKNPTPEAAAFMKTRNKIDKDMKAKGYVPYFDPAQRTKVDVANYPPNINAAVDAIPKRQDTIDKHLAVIGAEETRKRLRDAVARGQQLGDSDHWYWMGQLEKEFINELGEKEGREAFKQKFATSMAATTGGSDPGTNFLSAMYGNYVREQGLPYPAAANQLPYPISGGKHGIKNIEQHKRIFDEGGFEALGADNAKRHDFAWDFTGGNAPVIDEQMTRGMTPTYGQVSNKGVAPHKGTYGLYSQVVRDEAANMGKAGDDVQGLGWFGFKGAEGKPMISWVNDAIERTHRLTGVSRDDIMRLGIIRSKMPIYGLGAGLALPGLLDLQGGE
jgi:hypothetical protein